MAENSNNMHNSLVNEDGNELNSTEILPSNFAALPREQLEVLKAQGYLRYHVDARTQEPVYVLTEYGLAVAMQYQQQQNPALRGRLMCMMDWDRSAGSRFSPEFRRNLTTWLRQHDNDTERHYLVVHRDGHTSMLVKEGKQVLLLDSYNAFGVPDADHLPLLRIVRDALPEAKLYTNHDAYQHDYYNCRMFSLLAATEIENYCQHHQCGLEMVMNSNSNKYYAADPNVTIDKEKLDAYETLQVESIALPTCVIPLVQSYRMINTIATDRDNTMLQVDDNPTHLLLEAPLLQVTERSPGESYYDYLCSNTVTDAQYGKKVNATVENAAVDVLQNIYESLAITTLDEDVLEDTPVTQQVLVHSKLATDVVSNAMLVQETPISPSFA